MRLSYSACLYFFLLDVGLLSAICNLSAKVLIQGNDLFQQYKRALTEQYVMQQLNVVEPEEIAYWTNERSTNEVDFIIQNEVRIIPIEVKAEINVKSKSFRLFLKNTSLMLH